MISKKLALDFNRIIFNATEGSRGHRPYQTFDGKDLYPKLIDKSAALFQNIIINHPFMDGNNRWPIL